MPRIKSQRHAAAGGPADALSPLDLGPADVDPKLVQFWQTLPLARRRQLIQVDRRALFERIRSQVSCSRCFGLFQLRYEELKSNAQTNCPACKEFYSGMVVAEGGAVTLEESILRSQPFTTFEVVSQRERERELHFTGDVCGSGWRKQKGQTACALHTGPVPLESLCNHFGTLPAQHRDMLLMMREEDFVAELDAHLKYHLHLCKDCCFNVHRAFKDLKRESRSAEAAAGADDAAAAANGLTANPAGAAAGDGAEVSRAATGGGDESTSGDESGSSDDSAGGGVEGGSDGIEGDRCRQQEAAMGGPVISAAAVAAGVPLGGSGHRLVVGVGGPQGAVVAVALPDQSPGAATALFVLAEQVEETKVAAADAAGGECEAPCAGGAGPRHADTAEQARQVLADAAALIFKSQSEVAFREHTAGHNALLLFVRMATRAMEKALRDEFRDLNARQAEAELLEELEAVGSTDASGGSARPRASSKKARKKSGGSGGAPKKVGTQQQQPAAATTAAAAHSVDPGGQPAGEVLLTQAAGGVDDSTQEQQQQQQQEGQQQQQQQEGQQQQQQRCSGPSGQAGRVSPEPTHPDQSPGPGGEPDRVPGTSDDDEIRGGSWEVQARGRRRKGCTTLAAAAPPSLLSSPPGGGGAPRGLPRRGSSSSLPTRHHQQPDACRAAELPRGTPYQQLQRAAAGPGPPHATTPRGFPQAQQQQPLPQRCASAANAAAGAFAPALAAAPAVAAGSVGRSSPSPWAASRPVEVPIAQRRQASGGDNGGGPVAVVVGSEATAVGSYFSLFSSAGSPPPGPSPPASFQEAALRGAALRQPPPAATNAAAAAAAAAAGAGAGGGATGGPAPPLPAPPPHPPSAECTTPYQLFGGEGIFPLLAFALPMH